MDGDDRRSSQYAQSYHHPGSRPPTSQPMGLPATERFAQPGTPVRSETARHSVTRPYLPTYSGYGYPEQQYTGSSIQDGSPMQGVEIQYSPAGYVQNMQRQSTQQQQFAAAQYQHQGSILPAVPQQTMYDTMGTPYGQQSRQSAALEVMTSQLGGLPQYMQQPTDQQSSSMQQMQQQQHTPQQTYTSQPEHHQFPPRSTIPSQPTYPSSGSTPHQQHAHQHHSSDYLDPSPSQTPSQQPPQQQQPPSLTPAETEALLAGFRTFETQLSQSFASILSGRLPDAATSLLQITRWLASSIVGLGMNHDDENRHTERLALWRRLNVAWEALAWRQREGLEGQMGQGLGIQGAGVVRGGGSGGNGLGIKVMSVDAVMSLVDELVGICDQLEGFGLVDYEMGLAEEQIVAGFLAGLELMGDVQGQEGQGNQGRGGNAAVATGTMGAGTAAAASRA